MPEIHRPELDDEESEPKASAGARNKSILKIVLEAGLIALGVFLGLAGEQWRENARHRELADTSLRRFRAELLENRKAVADVQDYHVRMQKRLHTFFDTDPRTRKIANASLQGIRPVWFDHTAWDLAVATQSLI